MDDKEKITNATMKALQGQLEPNLYNGDKNQKELKRILESYEDGNMLEEFGKLFVTVTTDEELMIILKAIIEQYYNNMMGI